MRLRVIRYQYWKKCPLRIARIFHLSATGWASKISLIRSKCNWYHFFSKKSTENVQNERKKQTQKQIEWTVQYSSRILLSFVSRNDRQICWWRVPLQYLRTQGWRSQARWHRHVSILFQFTLLLIFSGDFQQEQPESVPVSSDTEDESSSEGISSFEMDNTNVQNFSDY